MEIPKIILKNMYKREFPLLVFKTYYKKLVVLVRRQTDAPMKLNRESRNRHTHIYGQLIPSKVANAFQQRKQSFQQLMLEQLDSYMEKNNKTSTHICYQIQKLTLNIP